MCVCLSAVKSPNRGWELILETSLPSTLLTHTDLSASQCSLLTCVGFVDDLLPPPLAPTLGPQAGAAKDATPSPKGDGGASSKAVAPDSDDKEMPRLPSFRRLWWAMVLSAVATSGYTLVKMLLLFNDTNSGWSWGLIMLAFCAPAVQVTE